MSSKAAASGAKLDTKRTLRVGVIGAGVMGSNHGRVLAGLPDTRLIGIVDPLPAHRLRATEMTGCHTFATLEELIAANLYRKTAQVFAVLLPIGTVGVMGDAFAGIIHPSKVYNILRIGATFLYIGPPMSHITEIAAQLPQGAVFMARHGDVDGVVGYILQSCTQSTTIERSAPSCVADHFSKVRLLPEMIQLLEEVSQGATS